MTGADDFAKMVPGFDFLQGLMKGASAALPQVNQWIAPTLDPAELDKRIQDLKTVQFWLEQNSRLLGASIQALEVQRMTLSTLQSMNLPLADLGAALRMPTPAEPPPAPPTPPPAAPEAVHEAPAAPPAPSGAIDPMQWWGALTQQFSEIAARALKDGGADLPRSAAEPAGPTGTKARASTRATANTTNTTKARAKTPAQAKAGPKTRTPAARKAPGTSRGRG